MGFCLLPLLLIFFIPFSSGVQLVPSDSISEVKGEAVVQWRRLTVEGPTSPSPVAENSSFILAAQRTRRQDPLNSFEKYTGGWNISNKHYWASVSYTAATLFVISAAWFVLFGLVLLFTCCYYCCCRRRNPSYSRVAYALSLVLLILFTLSAIVGCIVLYNGQGEFHDSTTKTLKYVVGQANITVQNLRNFSDDLSAAKKIGVDQVFLPGNVLGQIDEVVTKVNSSANSLDSRTSDNSEKIKNLLDTVRLILIIVSAVMLFLAFLGFLFSIFGLQFLVYLLVLVGWILVAGTFILCGVFLVLHNVVADTCVSMNEWVQHPSAHTALDDILPCVDVATANESLIRSRQVTHQLVNIVNQVISNVSNRNFPPGAPLVYYNQSGPLLPTLCNPYNADATDHACRSGEVDFNNATQVWKNYVCNATTISGSEICTTVGRLTPTINRQMTAAVTVSHGLHHYGPFLAQLEDCTFVRQTFSSISQNNCPGLRKYSRWVYIGLAMVSTAVMLSLIFWVIYARERRHRKYSKEAMLRRQQKQGVVGGM
ncbi:uncharacterized protein LOC109841191 [Asparagus officinalis]|uniref:uncharacterized protein LOC109841191 n=1 Tax=Asparagus officinalis TaxID=4686 RepID=UPI00098E7E2D|nr:uncharacterized protein LOC109841191 [Asparagus officinalis]